MSALERLILICVTTVACVLIVTIGAGVTIVEYARIAAGCG